MNRPFGKSHSVREKVFLLVQEQLETENKRAAGPTGAHVHVSSPQAVHCASAPCLARRERHHKVGARLLFSAVWKEIQMAGKGVWVLEVTTSCPDCEQPQTRILVPPIV